MNIYFPQGWTHFLLGIPLPARAGKGIQQNVKQLEAHFENLECLPTSAMMVLMHDLGICPIENHEAIQLSMKYNIQNISQFKLVARQWIIEEHEDHVSIWLGFKDRFDQFKDVQKKIQKNLIKYGFELDSSSIPKLLCAKAKKQTQSNLPHPMRMQMWAHEINIYQRPHTYLPVRGYDCITSFTLATEQISKDDHDDLDYGEEEEQRKQANHARILAQLEAKVATRDQNQQKYKNKPRKRLHRRRKQSPKKENDWNWKLNRE